jgi:hypothetical protein
VYFGRGGRICLESRAVPTFLSALPRFENQRLIPICVDFVGHASILVTDATTILRWTGTLAGEAFRVEGARLAGHHIQQLNPMLFICTEV